MLTACAGSILGLFSSKTAANSGRWRREVFLRRWWNYCSSHLSPCPDHHLRACWAASASFILPTWPNWHGRVQLTPEPRPSPRTVFGQASSYHYERTPISSVTLLPC